MQSARSAPSPARTLLWLGVRRRCRAHRLGLGKPGTPVSLVHSPLGCINTLLETTAGVREPTEGAAPSLAGAAAAAVGRLERTGRLPAGQDFPGGSMAKNPPAKEGDTGLIPGSGRSPGGGNGNLPLQYSCLENPVDREPGGLQSTGLQRVGHD